MAEVIRNSIINFMGVAFPEIRFVIHRCKNYYAEQDFLAEVKISQTVGDKTKKYFTFVLSVLCTYNWDDQLFNSYNC